MESLAQFAQMEVVEATTEWDNKGYLDGSDWWHDSMLVCRKPDNGTWRNAKNSLQRWVQHRTLTMGM